MKFKFLFTNSAGVMTVTGCHTLKPHDTGCRRLTFHIERIGLFVIFLGGVFRHIRSVVLYKFG